jgi:hypothetical protein
MSESDRRDAAPLLALVAVAAVAIVVYNAPRWAQSLAELAVRPATVTLVAALVMIALVVLTARLVVTRRALVSRNRLVMVPADSFDPTPEAVANFASGLSRSRRAVRGLLDAPASAVRVALDADPAGRLRYAIELPDHARGALRTAAAAYHGIDIHETGRDADPPPPAGSGTEVARAELVLARASSEPLRDAGLDPDPLAAFARALGTLHRDDGDTATVCIDLLPVTPGRRRRIRNRLLRQARRHDPTPATRPASGPRTDGPLGDLLAGPRRTGPAAPSELVERRVGQQALAGKLGSPEPLFSIQILVRVASPVPGRAKAQLTALLAAFDAYAGYNHLRVSGLPIAGAAFLGSDLPIRRRRFDRRVASGLFRPARRGIVTAGEIAGLLKPPSAKCAAPNVLRSGGIVGPPPPGLPTFAGQPGLLPLGKVTDEAGERIVGVPLRDTFFAYMAGRSRFGKTETAICQFVHLARTGHGCLFLDPHEDAIHKIKSYLADNEIRERVVEINLADHDQQPGWNLFAASCGTAGRQKRVDAVVDAFASALRWDETNTRALNLTTQAAQALCDLARRLPAELAPTIFQIPTLLANDDWRAAVLPHVSPPTREFFENRFPRLSTDAITPVTNLIDRLRVSAPTAALLGSPTSGYDIRAAMDQGKVVLVCPGSGSARDRLIANFVVYDVLHSAKTRADLPSDRRREFHVFLDEVQTYDGASSGTLAALLEQVAKFGVRVHLFNQNPERLTTATLNAVTTNRSHLLTTALNAKAAALLARDLGGQIEPQTIASLERFHSVGSVTLDGETSPPFRIHGIPVEELFPDVGRPDQVDALDATIARSVGRAPIVDTLALLDRHDQAILDHLNREPSDPATGGRQRVRRERR